MGARLYAQSPLPDLLPESPSAAHQYYENQGQIIDELGLLHPEIKYYTNDASPQLYLAEERISFVSWARGDANGKDTSYRIDLVFPECIQEDEGCPALVAEEAGDDHLNYYLSHCPNGITDVAGHNRVIYKNVEDYTDLHFYSSAVGFKSYIVFHPGADPSNFYMHFVGQDSINVLPSGDVDIYLGPMEMIFPQATAYTIDASGQTFPLSWLPIWIYNGVGEVTLAMGAYNPAHTLVVRIGGGYVATPPIRNLTWSTYYGGDDIADTKELAVNSLDNLFHLMTIAGGTFPHHRGQQTRNGGQTDAFISKFDDKAKRKWGTYFGGAGEEYPEDITLDDTSSVFITGWTQEAANTQGLPLINPGSGFYQYTNNGNADAFLLELDQFDGWKLWATYFGGTGTDRAYSIDVDTSANMLVIAGETTSGGVLNCNQSTQFPLCNNLNQAYVQASNKGNGDGFVTQFNLSTRSLDWSTFFGGSGAEIAYDVLINNPTAATTASIFICGFTGSKTIPANTSPPLAPLPPSNGAFPLTATASSPTYFQTHFGDADGQAFVAKFDAARQLQWSTYFGASGSSGGNKSKNLLYRLAHNSLGDIYAVGSTWMEGTTSLLSCATNSNGNLPICNQNGTSYIESQAKGWQDGLIVRFSNSGQLQWSTLYASDASDFYKFDEGARITLDIHDNVYIAGSNAWATNPSINQPLSTQNVAGNYFQASNASASSSNISGDVFILVFDENNHRVWATHFGGGCPAPGPNNPTCGDEFPTGIAVFSDQRLYITGVTESPRTPYTCPGAGTPYCDPSLSIGFLNRNAFITRFELSYLNTAIDQGKTINPLQIFPNPVENLLSIQTPSEVQGSVQIQILDQVGRVVQQENHQANTAALQIDVSELGSGVYYLTLTSNNQRYVAKWIK